MTDKKQSFPPIYLYRRIVQAKLFIDSNYAEQINLNDIAGEAMLSKFHFIRLFKAAYGKTPHQYLTSVRIAHAGELMKSGMSVSEVCFTVGFDSISSFSALFRKFNALTPSAFRAYELKRKQMIAKAPLQFVPGCFAEMNGWRAEKQF
ncbi:MAG: helix-turn-helix domain-containing protein [Cytophagaceae bacterium]